MPEFFDCSYSFVSSFKNGSNSKSTCKPMHINKNQNNVPAALRLISKRNFRIQQGKPKTIKQKRHNINRTIARKFAYKPHTVQTGQLVEKQNRFLHFNRNNDSALCKIGEHAPWSRFRHVIEAMHNRQRHATKLGRRNEKPYDGGCGQRLREKRRRHTTMWQTRRECEGEGNVGQRS